MIIDAHTHIFKRISGVFEGAPFTSENYGRARTGNRAIQFLPPAFNESNSTYETLLSYMDWQEVDRSVLLPNPLYGYHNEYVIEAVSAYPQCFAGIALVDLFGGEVAANELATLHARGLKGLKIEESSAFAFHPGAELDDDSCLPLWRYCDQRAEPVFLHMSTYKSFKVLRRLAERFTNIPIVICHLGAESILQNEARREERLGELISFVREHPKAMVDTSGVFCQYTWEEYPFPESTACLMRFYQEVGAERMMWGSDYPGTLNLATYRQLLDQVRIHCGGMPEYDKERILGGNVRDLLWAD